MTFSAQIFAFTRKCGMRADQVVRKVVLDLGREIVQRTPVDTGMARSNYFFGYDRITSIDHTKSNNGAPSLSRAAEFTGTLKAGTVCYITNNVPYIMTLEMGRFEGPPGRGSIQAPEGMARVTVARFHHMVIGAVGAL